MSVPLFSRKIGNAEEHKIDEKLVMIVTLLKGPSGKTKTT